MTNINSTINVVMSNQDDEANVYRIGNNAGSQTVLCAQQGTVIKGKVSGVGEQASVTIGTCKIAVSADVTAGRQVGDEMYFQVESSDGKSVALKAMQEYVGVRSGGTGSSVGETLESMSQVTVQRNTEQFVTILSESDLKVDVSASEETAEDAEQVAHLSADDLQMLRRMGIDVANSDLSHLMGLVNQYHAQQEGRTFQTGSPEVVEAVAKAQSVDEIDDGTKRYMVQQNMDLTYENVYVAQHSAPAYTTEQEMSDAEWQELKPQAEQLLNRNGFDADESTLQVAKWLIEQDLDVTAENVKLVQQMDTFNADGLDAEAYAENAVAQLKVGETATTALLSGDSAGKAAESLVEDLSHITEAAVERVVVLDEQRDIAHYIASQQILDGNLTSGAADYELGESISESFGVMPAEDDSTDFQESANQQDRQRNENQPSKQNLQNEVTEEYRKLQEIRLRMTLSSGYQLLRQDSLITSRELSQVIAELDALENREVESMLRDSLVENTDQNRNLYRDTMMVTACIPRLPGATLAVATQSEVAVSLESIYERGIAYANRYAMNVDVNGYSKPYETISGALSSYETMMTQPRGDMGDSIRKAFRNVEDMLDEMGVETTDANCKAARILAYNQMEITSDAVAQIAELDTQLQEVLQEMTPEVVLGLIRDQKNPLTLSLSQLKSSIDEVKEQLGSGVESSYSEYLYALDREGSITSEERDSFIGIYRLLHAVNSQDTRALGALVRSEEEIDLNHLLSAHKSQGWQGHDVTIDDVFGMLESVERKGVSIADQIAAAYDSDDEYLEMEQEQIRNLSNVSKDAVELCAQLELPNTPANLLATEQLISNSDSLYQNIKRTLERSGNSSNTAFDELEEQMLQRMAQRAANGLEQDAQALVQAVDAGTETPNDVSEYDADTSDVFWNPLVDALHERDEVQTFTARELMAGREIRTMMRAVGAMEQQDEHFLVPIATDNEVLTMSVHLTSGAQKGFQAQIQTPRYGLVEADCELVDGQLAWSLYCEDAQGSEILEQNRTRLEQAFDKASNGDDAVRESRGFYESAKELVAVVRDLL